MKMIKKNRFIITSHGWSASNWLAYALSSHPDIIATHSAANLYNEQLTNDIQGKVKQFHKGYVNRQNITISEAYQKIIAFGDAKSYGSVHLYRLRDLPIVHSKFGEDKNTYKTFNLIRHPINLVLSGYGQFKELFKTDINELHWTLSKIIKDKEEINEICDHHNILPGELNNLSFIGACCVLGSLELDQNAYQETLKIPHIDYIDTIKMEEITTSKQVMKDLLYRINPELDVSDEYLNSIYTLKQINTHNKYNNKTPQKIYFELASWQREVLNYYLKKHRIIEAYEHYNYDFSFCKEE